MRFDDDGNIWLRQSWLDTAFRCAERGRLAITKPEYNFGGDAAHLGTGTHSAIELKIASLNNGTTLTRAEILTEIERSIQAKIDEEGVRWIKYNNIGELIENAERCYVAWRDGILPVLDERGLIIGARCEVKFQVVLFTLSDGRTVGVEGTIDLAPEAPELVDWKTSGQAYRIREKQKFAIQPTIYSMAAVLGEVRDDVEYTWPMRFTYGVAIRGVKKAKPQLLTVTRTQAHADFAIERIKTYVDLALNHTLDRPWPRNDDHYLCSATWCPWWYLCKGGHSISDQEPVQLTIKESE